MNIAYGGFSHGNSEKLKVFIQMFLYGGAALHRWLHRKTKDVKNVATKVIKSAQYSRKKDGFYDVYFNCRCLKAWLEQTPRQSICVRLVNNGLGSGLTCSLRTARINASRI